MTVNADLVSGTSSIETRAATVEDVPAITEIYNQGIEERIATFEAEPRSVEAMEGWLAEHQGRYLAIVAEIDGQVAGWASVGQYRPRECYAGIGEYSIYIHRDFRGKGVGKVLLRALIAAAAEQGYWKLTSRIFVENVASRKLCEATGFREVGIYEKHAKLDGVWHDCVIVEYLIPQNID